MTQLRVAMRIAGSTSEGPGVRYALWVQGCSIRCPGCCNPEMFSLDGGILWNIDELLNDVDSSRLTYPELEGISVLGGEPFEQCEALAELCLAIQHRGLSVMIYTGYRLAELEEKRNTSITSVLANCDLLVDGRFDAAQPERQRRWIGSNNQKMFALTSRYLLDDPQMCGPNTVEIRLNSPAGELGNSRELTVHGWPSAAQKLVHLSRGKPNA